MIEQIDLTGLSVNQLVAIYNSLNKDAVDSYQQQKQKHEIMRIKKKLISLKQTSEYVLDYEGTL
jgi:hypothetical protein